jgi:hypothetical protein
MVQIKHNFNEIGRQLGSLLIQYANAVDRGIDVEMQRQAGLLRNDIIEGWPVATGASRAAWQGPLKVGYAHYEMRNQISYAAVIEYGGYQGVGPKTAAEGPQMLPGGIAVGGGIFPTQRPSHPVARALSKRTVELNNALAKVLKQ